MRHLIPAKQGNKMRPWFALVLALCALISAPATLWAHPLGNFTVNRYSRLEVNDKVVRLIHIIDMAEIPTQQELAVIDRNRDGKRSAEELAAYIEEMAVSTAANAHLMLAGHPVTWQIVDQAVEFPPGQADLPTLRLTVQLLTALPAADQWQADYSDDGYSDRLGWREVVVKALPGATLVESSVPQQELSNELRNYPADLLQSPAAVTKASFRFVRGGSGSEKKAVSEVAKAPATAGATSAGLAKPSDGFANLITQSQVGPLAILLALLAAFGWGALHALTPGHGKTIVAAYLVGARGTARHALFLGLTTTLTHTAGVFLLGFVTLFLSKYILPETLYPWLGVISGLLVVLIGLSLIRGRLGTLWGLAPSAHTHCHSHEAGNEHDWLDGHDHGPGIGHTHMFPGADGPVSWRRLLALGVSGGLLPCPSALVLMLGAIALDRIGFGLILIFIFSIGLASVLTGIGLMLVFAGRFFERLPENGRLLQLMPVASAAFITLVGVGIAWQALVQTGVLRLG
jgi:ABC-type nickel/cobalt efflux system permease component RcnA